MAGVACAFEPGESAVEIGFGRGVPIHVVATTRDGTRAAIGAADSLASLTESRVYVLARTTVPEGVARRSPAEAAAAFAEDLRDLPESRSARVAIVSLLSGEASDLLPLLPPSPIVFIGGPTRRWWPTAAQRLAHDFTCLGCRVVFIHES